MEHDNTPLSKSTFLNAINYQIRTQLNSIIGFSNALLAMEQSEKERKFIEDIKSSGVEILKILDEKSGDADLTENAKPEINTQKLSRLHFKEIQKLKILLVEDDFLNIKLIEHLFSEYGMHADVAYNGKIAIEKISKEPYNLILMDIEMPEMNGYDTTRYIREKMNSHVPVIAITGHAMAGERQKCLDSGMNDYITKPIDAGLLFELIYKNLSALDLPDEQVAEPLTNLAYLKETMNDKREAIKEILDYLSIHLPLYLSELNIAIENTDYNGISKMAHKIKSAAGIVGVNNLKLLLTKLETAGLQYAEMNEINDMHQKIKILCNSVLAEIEIERKNYH